MSEPEWRRAAENLRARISAWEGVHERGGRWWLPRYEALQEELGISYATLRTATIFLEAEGWIIRRPAVGIEVHPDHVRPARPDRTDPT